jgi:hypothetical protein
LTLFTPARFAFGTSSIILKGLTSDISMDKPVDNSPLNCLASVKESVGLNQELFFWLHGLRRMACTPSGASSKVAVFMV